MPTFTAGAEFRVNTTTSGNQGFPAIARLAGGVYVVVWADDSGLGGDPSPESVKGQLIDAHGNKIGPEFLINQNTASRQYDPRIAVLGDGSFVVTWTDDTGDASGWAIKARHYDASGAPLGNEFLVNTKTSTNQWDADILALPSGGFLVTWADQTGDSSLYGTRAQLFDAVGAKVGAEFQVNTTEFLYQNASSMAALPGGGFVVTWNDFSHSGGDFDRYSIRAQLYDAAGNRIGGEFLVNTITANDQGRPHVASLAGGGFVITWMDNSFLGGDPSVWSVRAQVFDGAGARVGGEFGVNTQTLGQQEYPIAIGLASGGFAIAWQDEFGDGSGYAVKARLFDATGTPHSGEFLLNASTSGNQDQPFLLATPDGFVAAWGDASGAGGDASGFAVTMRSFYSDDRPVNFVGAPATGDEDAPIALTGISVFDAGSNPATDEITVHLSVEHGTITIRTDVAGGISVADITGGGGNGSRGITITATQDQINATLVAAGGLTYQGDPDFFGTDGLTVSTHNGVNVDPASLAPVATSGALVNPSFLVNGDIDGDGILDLVYAGATGVGIDTNRVGIRIGDGAGGFAPTTAYDSGGTPRQVVPTDIDEDGDVDVVVTNYGLGAGGANGVVVLLNDGAGNLGPHQLIANLPQAYDLLAADFNGDGRTDLAVAQDMLGTVTVLLASGPPGTFAAPVTYTANSVFLRTFSIVAGDYTGDGRPDLIAINFDSSDSSSGEVSILINNGDGGFGAPVHIALAQRQPWDGAAGDLNGDGRLDLVYVTHGAATPRGLHVLLGNGNGTFQPGVFYATADFPIGVSIGDVNGDGRPDLISGSGNSGTIAVFVGNGDGTFRPRADFSASTGFAGQVSLGDFDRDGDTDIALNRAHVDGQGVFLNTTASRGDVDVKPIIVNDVADVNVINGTEGDDNLVGTPGVDEVNGLGGNDTITARAGDDLADGGTGNDSIHGQQGNDHLLGGDGHDFFRGGTGDDVIEGGDGFDRVSHFQTGNDTLPATGVTVSLLLQGVPQDTGHGMDTLIGIEALSGSLHDDTLIGDNGNNWLWTSGDLLTAETGNDTLIGNGGNDLIQASPGDHFLNGGGGGVDTLSLWDNGTGASAPGATVSLALQGGPGSPTSQDTGIGVMTIHNFENVSGTQFDDTLGGDGNANVLAGYVGNDHLTGGGGDDTLLGDGWIGFDPNGPSLPGTVFSFGHGVIVTVYDVTETYGDPGGDDVLDGGEGDDTLIGGAGDDLLIGGGGSMDGGTGMDTASWADSAGGIVLQMNAPSPFAETPTGVDEISGIETFIGSEHDDLMIGDGNDNYFFGIGGHDQLIGSGGHDLLDGGDGDDVLQGGQGDDTLVGGAGADNLSGNPGDDTLDGGDGGDALVAGPGNDSLYGGDEDDFLRGDNADGLTPGNDYIDAGAGFDRVTYYNLNNGVTISLLLQGTAQDTGQGMDTLLNTEAISGSVFSDTLIGDDADNWFFIGGAGVDHHTVTSDTIIGNGGNDLIVAGFGDHVFDGGTGTDTLGFTWVRTELSAGVTVSLALQGGAQDTGQGSMSISGFENLSGSMFDDSFVGDNGSNLLSGGAASDVLSGAAGNDVLLGDGEVNMDSTNIAGAGPIATFDSLDYAGVDFYDSAGNIVYLFEGQDLYDVGGNALERADLVDEGGTPYSRFTLNGVTYDLYVGDPTASDGVTGNDILDGGDGDDTLVAGAGDDTLIGGAGNDSLDGGDGLDTASYEHAGGPVDLNLGAGFAEEYAADGVTVLSADTLSGIENADGSAHDDALVGDANANVLRGLGGHDLIFGGAGGDTLEGGEGNDALRGELGAGYAGPGGNDSLTGGSGHDYLNGGQGVDSFDGGEGFDRISFVSNHSTQGVVANLMTGVISNDGFGNAETMTNVEALGVGTIFADTFIGDDNANFLWGGSDLGGGVGDTLTGNGGDDLLQVFPGDHVLDGGDGIDSVSLFDNGTGVTSAGASVSLLLQGAAQDTRQGMMILTGIENLSGTTFDDELTGDGSANVLAGERGSDHLVGGGGDDRLLGDGSINTSGAVTGSGGPIVTTDDVAAELGEPGGDDLLEGGLGNDQLIGGGGIDTASYANSDGPVDLNLGAGFAEEYAADGITVLSADTLSGIENATGSAHDDALVGDGNANLLRGLGGHDIIFGGAGGDTLEGGEGNDALRGDGQPGYNGPSGDDTLIGGAGNDFMNGGAGTDSFDGGTGFDRISFFNRAATQGAIASLVSGTITNDGYGNAETMTGIEGLGGGTAFADHFTGDDNANDIFGGIGDTLLANGGDDFLLVIGAPVLVDGGGGVDTAEFAADIQPALIPDANDDGLAEQIFATSGVHVDLGANQIVDDGFGNSGAIVNVENVGGSELDDQIFGDGNANVLAGRGGNDTLFGFGGSDTLDGGDGDDVMRGEGNYLYNGAGGNDVFLGGDGDDYMNGMQGVDSYDGGDGLDRISFYNAAATQGAVASLVSQSIGNDGFGNAETMVSVEGLGSGTAFADHFTGDDNGNDLFGSIGDTIIANGGDDSFQLEGGPAFLDGGDGIDTINSFVRFTIAPDNNGDGLAEDVETTAGVVIDLRFNTIVDDGFGNSGMIVNVENVGGSEFEDILIGDGNANTLSGFDGADQLEGAGGSDTLDGGTGIDTVSYAGAVGPVAVHLGGGWADELDADFNPVSQDVLVDIERAIGSAFDDFLSGSGGNDMLAGGSGDDELVGHLGDDHLDGGDGTDFANYSGAAGVVVVNLLAGTASGDGNDTLDSIEQLGGSNFDDHLIGDSNNNVILGFGGDDLIEGGDGHDHLQGNQGNDSVYGGAGNDLLRGQDGDDLIDGGDGFDRFSDFAGATSGVTISLLLQGVQQNTGRGWDILTGIEALSGTPFDDHLTGDHGTNWFLLAGGGNDVVSGEGGDDLIEAGAGNHQLDGGAGIDTASLRGNTLDIDENGVTVSLTLQGAAQDTEQGMMILTGFENLSGSIHDDALSGDGGANVLAGDEGADTLSGGAGDDLLLGDGAVLADVPAGAGTAGPPAIFNEVTELFASGHGDDLLEGGLGNDTLVGGGGIDTASYASSIGFVEVDLGAFFANEHDSGETQLSSDSLTGIENVVGSEFDDFIVGDHHDNRLTGLGGADSLQGRAGDDLLEGGEGNDSLLGDGGFLYNGPSGNDVLLGGGGNDHFRGGAGVDSFDGGTGSDRISFFEAAATQGVIANLLTQTIANDGYGNAETMVSIEGLGAGTAFADHFTGDDNANELLVSFGDTIIANGGDDSIHVLGAPALIDGGSGADTLIGFVADTFGVLVPDSNGDGLAEVVTPTDGMHVDLGLGMIVDDGFGNSGTIQNIENVVGSDLDDVLVGGDDDNGLDGGAGDDLLEGGLGNDTLAGGGGIDTASYANAIGFVEVNLGAFFANEHDTGETQLSSDTLSGIENVIGSEYDDILFGDANANLLRGLGGHDTLFGFAGDDAIEGGDGNDFLRGYNGNDTLQGGGDHDLLRGGNGDDVMDGGAGFDRVSFFSSAGESPPATGVTVSLLLQGVAQDTGHGMDTLIGIEALNGTPFDDHMTGDHGANWLLLGSGGNDTGLGEGGDDLIMMANGNHVAQGGAGIDTAAFASGFETGGVTVSLALQPAAQVTGIGTMTLSGFENLSGSVFDDSLTGDAAANLLAGNAGNDTLSGGDGADSLYGDGGMIIDFPPGVGTSGPITFVEDLAPGNDVLLGGDGTDLLNGGGGDDVMTGGKHADRFEFGETSGHDRITDFDKTELIAIDVAGVDGMGDLTLTQVGNDTLVSWSGGAASVLLDNIKPSKLSAANFDFGDGAGLSLASLLSWPAASGEGMVVDIV